MKTKSLLLEFFTKSRKRYPHLILLPETPEITSQLQNATGILSLRKLFGRNEELMFAVLQSILVLPGLHRINQATQKSKRDKKNKPRDIQNQISQLSRKFYRHMRQIKILDPTIDSDRLKKKRRFGLTTK